MRILGDTPEHWGLWLGAGENVTGDRETAPVINPFNGLELAWVEQASGEDVDQAVMIASEAAEKARVYPSHERAVWLKSAARAMEERRAELVDTLVYTLGKPRRASQGEATRGPALLRMCAEEIARMSGECLPLDAVPGGEGLWSLTRHEPYGVAAVITPFNAPINLLLQKIAPALATGNSVIIKPSPEGAVVTNQLAEIIAPCFPEGMITVLHGGGDVAGWLVEHPKVNVVSLTGGTSAGRSVIERAGIKPVKLELGSNSPNLVLPGADINYAAQRISSAAFAASGQQCISAQRIIVHEEIYQEFVSRFLEASESLVVGDPNDEATDIGPMIHATAATRVGKMIHDAISKNATVLLDGRTEDLLLGPTVLADLDPNSRLLQQEAFGPVAVLIRVRSTQGAIEVANNVPGMLQASCFTSDLETMMQVSESIHAGSVWINEPTRFRLDVHPFGGYGSSGIGREGVRWAMEELSQIKHIGIRRPASV